MGEFDFSALPTAGPMNGSAGPVDFDFEGFFTEVGGVFEPGDDGQTGGHPGIDLGGLEGVLGDI